MRRAPRFVLDGRLAPARAARRAALDQLDHALASLARRESAAAHEARKVCKRVRALLRLLQPQLGDAVYRADNRRLRDAARLLAAEREAEVLPKTARAVKLPPRRRAVARDPAARRIAARMLETARRRVDRWRLRGLSRAALAKGLERGYRRARRALRAAQRRPEAAVIHEWRKLAKYHGYQCELASAIWPALEARRRDLDPLSEALGFHHDLEMLRLARSEPSERIHREQDRTAARAFKLGAALFARRKLPGLGR